jgi:two-component system nitrogen regulation sensor histidine kinase NtrY
VTFRTRLLLIFILAVIVSVGLVEGLVLHTMRRAFERLEGQRVDALVAQFRKEFDRRRREIALTVKGIAESEAVLNTAIAADPAPYYNEAASLAAAHNLDLLELVAGDGAIISSAEWPARFGYKEDWLISGQDWRSLGAFLRREELPTGITLALVAVSAVRVGDRTLYVVGGHELDSGFLNSLVLPSGMRALFYRKLTPQFSASELLGGQAGDVVRLRPLIETVERSGRESHATVGEGADSETFYALLLPGYRDSLLGVLLVGSTRRDLVELESSLRTIGTSVAAAGVLLGIVLGWWATARVTRPVRRLAESAGKVAAGDWGATVEVASRDEVGQLAQAFNRMTHQLVEQRERLLQAERVAAWRELARRLAHELKNPLFPLQITIENMQRARERRPEQFDEVFREGTSTLLAELAHLKQIIARFSDFARMPAPEMTPVDLHRLVLETLKLFEPQLAAAQIVTRIELDPKLGFVRADAEQMRRALRNLILNAVDAMSGGGTLTVRTRAADAGVLLEVADTGQGLTPEECERLFTPYYTTKQHGTGLGLAIVQSVVSDHRGKISVESEPGRGTTFRIELG